MRNILPKTYAKYYRLLFLLCTIDSYTEIASELIEGLKASYDQASDVLEDCTIWILNGIHLHEIIALSNFLADFICICWHHYRQQSYGTLKSKRNGTRWMKTFTTQQEV
jgi:hypothetical protein